MSLKDKAFEAKTITFWNGGGRIYTEPVPLVELEDAEKEIEKWKELNEADQSVVIEIGKINESLRQEIETAQSTITSQAIQLERKDKEIQTLVELLKYTGEELAAIRNKSKWWYSTSDDVYHLQKKITQTLKKYEHRG